MQARAAEETAALRKKARDMEADARRGFEERRWVCKNHNRRLSSPFLSIPLLVIAWISSAFPFHFVDLLRVHESRELADRQKLEADREDFAAHVTSASRAAEVQREYIVGIRIGDHCCEDITVITLFVQIIKSCTLSLLSTGRSKSAERWGGSA